MDTLPDYLTKYYWWAYVHPRALWLFDREWLINLILYGNYTKLRDAALGALGEHLPGRTLQISCCYGELTPRVAERIERSHGSFYLIDIVPAQLANARKKILEHAAVRFSRMDASKLDFSDATFDRVLLFFLLHEEPQAYREATMREALRVLKPGGRVVIADFGKPAWWHPFRPYLFFLGFLEPFAREVWRHELIDLLPDMHVLSWTKTSYFGGLFQVLIGERR
jgi:ubiquinone/menaquinone biosynthesis C-methylase UbiE